MSKQYYVLFPSHTAGMELYTLLKQKGIQTIIAPTPRNLSKCCGISLLIKEEEVEVIKKIIEENKAETLGISAIENKKDVYRDVFC